MRSTHVGLLVGVAIAAAGCGSQTEPEHGNQSEASSGFQYGALGTYETMDDARKRRREADNEADNEADKEAEANEEAEPAAPEQETEGDTALEPAQSP